ncbi:MAG: SH3 domain-containing protein [Clostridia bacterium]|nr:SH3 domain-containing protein [Clostridia bacterium]
MSVIIGSARIDERGKAIGGKAGDQTGKEVSTQAWYKHSKGWRVFRAKNTAARRLIAGAMQAACKNGNIGYDQGQRSTLYEAVKDYGFDPAKATKAVETDCSALVRVCCAFAGIDLPDFITSNQASALLNSGAFEDLKGAKYTDEENWLEEGDILVTKTKGHTAIVLTNGDKAEEPASPSPFGDLTVADGSWNIRSGPGAGWPVVRTAKGGDRLQSVDENGWIPVLIDGQVRWISPKGVSE